MGLNIRTPEVASTAVAALRDARPLLAKHFPEHGPRVRFQGLEMLDGGRVLMSPAAPECANDVAKLVALTAELREHFAARLPSNVFGVALPDAGTPRVVVAKVRRVALRNGARLITKEDFEPFAESVDLGTYNFSRIELLSALSADSATGLYRPVAHVDFPGVPEPLPDDETPDDPELFLKRFPGSKQQQQPATAAAAAAPSAEEAPKALPTQPQQQPLSVQEAEELQRWREFGKSLQSLIKGSPIGDAVLAAMPQPVVQVKKKRLRRQLKRAARQRRQMQGVPAAPAAVPDPTPQ